MFEHLFAHSDLFFRSEGAVPEGLQIHVIQMQIMLKEVDVLLKLLPLRVRRAVGDKIGGQPEIAIMTHPRIPPVFGYQIGTL